MFAKKVSATKRKQHKDGVRGFFNWVTAKAIKNLDKLKVFFLFHQKAVFAFHITSLYQILLNNIPYKTLRRTKNTVMYHFNF